MERPSKSHSLPKTVRHPAKTRGKQHPASVVAYDTRIIARNGVEFWKLHPAIGTSMKALRE